MRISDSVRNRILKCTNTFFTQSVGLIAYVWAHSTSLINRQFVFMEMPVRNKEGEKSLYICGVSIDLASSFYDCSIIFWCCFNSMVFFFLLFKKKCLGSDNRISTEFTIYSNSTHLRLESRMSKGCIWLYYNIWMLTAS